MKLKVWTIEFMYLYGDDNGNRICCTIASTEPEAEANFRKDYGVGFAIIQIYESPE